MLAFGRELRQQRGGAAELATQSDALDDPQCHKESGRSDAQGRVAGEETGQTGCDAHHE